MSGIQVSDDVWAGWREESARDGEWAIVMRLSTGVEPGDAIGILADVVHRVASASPPECPWSGAWDWQSAGADVLIRVEECEDFEATLPHVLDGLVERGLTGRLELFRPAKVDPRPSGPLIECRMRVRGHRVRRNARNYAWVGEPTALSEVALHAAEWCLDHGRHPSVALQVDLMPPIEVPAVALARRVQAALENATAITIVSGWVRTEDGGRLFAIHPGDGRVSAVLVGADDARLDWRTGHEEFARLLRDQAGALAYAFVKRGANIGYADLGISLAFDWPPRSRLPSHDLQRTSEGAFEDEYAADAFGFQLLGPGFANRLPETPSYRAETIGDAVLLEHVDLSAWYAKPLVPPDAHFQAMDEVVTPPVLAEARTELAPILMRPDRVPTD